MPSLSKKDRVSLCLFTFSDGRRCRTPRIATHPHFCHYHAQKEAQSLATQKLSNELTYFFSGSYLAACDLSTALSRIIPAVIRGDVKPKTARTVAYLAQTLLQSIRVSQHEYINAYGTDFWRGAVQDSVKSDRDYLFPPKPTPPSAPPPNATVPSPSTPPISTVATAPAPSPVPAPAPPRAPQNAATPTPASPANDKPRPQTASKAAPTTSQAQPIPAPQPAPPAAPLPQPTTLPKPPLRPRNNTSTQKPADCTSTTTTASPSTANPGTANPFRINTSAPASQLLILNHLHHG
jgi:hypothetical protein